MLNLRIKGAKIHISDTKFRLHLSSYEHLNATTEDGAISHDQDGDKKQKSLTLNKENFNTVQGSTIPVLKAY